MNLFTMVYFYNESHDPYFNLALEEFFLKEKEDDYLILSVNDSSVVIGKHQVAHREVDTEAVTKNRIPVVRRISGGGTVYHDRGNVNFAFILNSEQGRQVDFKKYTLPVISFLKSLGVDAELGDKNDIRVNGLKISGNAEHVYRSRVLHHGTLLFDADLVMLRSVLRKKTDNYMTRAVSSNPSPVANLKGIIRNIYTVYEFIEAMMKWFITNLPGEIITSLESEDDAKIQLLSKEKYRKWEWNYCYGPEYQFSNDFMLNGIPHNCILKVRDGIIMESGITGLSEMERVSPALRGYSHMPDEMYELFRKNNCPVSWNDIFNFF